MFVTYTNAELLVLNAINSGERVINVEFNQGEGVVPQIRGFLHRNDIPYTDVHSDELNYALYAGSGKRAFILTKIQPDSEEIIREYVNDISDPDLIVIIVNIIY